MSRQAKVYPVLFAAEFDYDGKWRCVRVIEDKPEIIVGYVVNEPAGTIKSFKRSKIQNYQRNYSIQVN